MSEIKVLIADERKLFRQGLICLFTKELGILVAGDTGDGLDAEKMVHKKKPDVLVLNVRLPALDGISVAQRVSKRSDPPRIVFLSDRHNEMLMREALHAGAQAYLLQDCDFKELVFAIRKVATGEYYLTGPAGRQLVMEYVTPSEGVSDPPGLMTRRELEICRLLSDGFSTKEVADRLNISAKTVETHRATIMKKLHAKNVTDIVKYCIRNQIIEP